jgi:hypothetical protein
MAKANIELDLKEDTWEEAAPELAYSMPDTELSKAVVIYAASKVLMERVVWKFVKDKKPGFYLNTILGTTFFGPILDPNQPASMGALIRMGFHGNFSLYSYFVPCKSFLTIILPNIDSYSFV